MANDLEQLPKLIQRAAASLAKATNAAEFLEAREQANVAYTAAKMTARLTKFKDAHDTVIAACRKAMADALVIEAQTQCRLADEYDAAQERGEVQSGGRPKTIPNENSFPTVTDIGLTSKQVHEARQIRDAEKAKPGIVRKTVEARLEAHEEPTRADVRRAVKPIHKGRKQAAPRAGDEQRQKRNEKIIAMHDRGASVAEIAVEFGIVERQISIILQKEKIRREAANAAPVPTREDLSMSAREKLDAAIRQHKHKLELSFELAVREEARKRMDEIILPHWKKQIAEAQKLYERRTGLMNKATFNAIRRALHPDSRNSISDQVLAEAFHKFMALEKYLLNEENSPTTWGDLPSSSAEWDKMRVKRAAVKRPNPSPLRTR